MIRLRSIKIFFLVFYVVLVLLILKIKFKILFYSNFENADEIARFKEEYNEVSLFFFTLVPADNFCFFVYRILLKRLFRI